MTIGSRAFPAYLQQLDMESTGKRVRVDGSPVFSETAPVRGVNRATTRSTLFSRCLHQGTPRAALDFLLPALSSSGDQLRTTLAIANCLAQAEAFAFGPSNRTTRTRYMKATGLQASCCSGVSIR